MHRLHPYSTAISERRPSGFTPKLASTCREAGVVRGMPDAISDKQRLHIVITQYCKQLVSVEQ